MTTWSRGIRERGEGVSASHPHEKADARTLEFKVPVPKGKEAKLAYRVRIKF